MRPLTPTTPHVIIMVGIPGAGKTAFAEHFAKTFQAPYINPREIMAHSGIDAAATEKVTKLFFDELLKTNRTLIYEGPTATRLQRQAVVKQVSQTGYKPLIVWVQTESVEAKRRATKKQAETIALTPTQFDAHIKKFQPPVALERAVVISGKHTYTTQLKVVLKHLASPRPELPSPELPITERPRPQSGRNITVR